MREEEKNQTSKFQKMLKKRWVLPAVYVSFAAIILALVLIVQTSFNNTANEEVGETAESGKEFNEPALEVNSNLEKFIMPVANEENAVVKKEFYDANADEEKQEAALVFYNNRYEPNKGIDIAANDGKAFEVLASLSGSVTKVQEDGLLGNVIEIEHEDGVVTRYQSVTDIKVAVGDQVKQGQAIATAGKSQINEDAGTHVHFEIRKDSIAVNPIEYFDKQASSIEIATKSVDEEEMQDETEQTENTENQESTENQ